MNKIEFKLKKEKFNLEWEINKLEDELDYIWCDDATVIKKLEKLEKRLLKINRIIKELENNE